MALTPAVASTASTAASPVERAGVPDLVASGRTEAATAAGVNWTSRWSGAHGWARGALVTKPFCTGAKGRGAGAAAAAAAARHATASTDRMASLFTTGSSGGERGEG